MRTNYIQLEVLSWIEILWLQVISYKTHYLKFEQINNYVRTQTTGGTYLLLLHPRSMESYLYFVIIGLDKCCKPGTIDMKPGQVVPMNERYTS